VASWSLAWKVLEDPQDKGLRRRVMFDSKRQRERKSGEEVGAKVTEAGNDKELGRRAIEALEVRESMRSKSNAAVQLSAVN